MIRARGLVTTIALACLLAPLAISTETVAAGTTSTGSDDGSQSGHRDDPGHRTPPAQKAALQPCRNGHARCGTVRRLLDPTRPNGARIGIGFELYPRRDRSRPSLGTIVAVEGGPDTRPPAAGRYYRDLFEPLLERRQLLLVDQRGTGTSGADPVPAAPVLPGQPQPGDRHVRPAARRRPPTSTGPRSPPTTWPPCSTSSASTGRPVRRLVRHLLLPDVRSAPPRPGPTADARRRVLRRRHRPVVLRHQPRHAARVHRRLPAQPGVRHDPAARCSGIAGLAGAAAQTPDRRPGTERRRRRPPRPRRRGTPDRPRSPTPRPTRRSTASSTPRPGPRCARDPYIDRCCGSPASDVRRRRRARAAYSEGLYVAVACNDYPQPFDVTARRRRPQQFHRAHRAASHTTQPGLFGPFTVRSGCARRTATTTTACVAGAQPLGAPGPAATRPTPTCRRWCSTATSTR